MDLHKIILYFWHDYRCGKEVLKTPNIKIGIPGTIQRLIIAIPVDANMLEISLIFERVLIWLIKSGNWKPLTFSLE